MNKPETHRKDLFKDTVVGVRLNGKQQERFAAMRDALAIPFNMPMSSIVKTFALVGIEAFERKNKKGKAK